MFFADFLFALAIGLLLTALFGAAFRIRGPGAAWWTFLLIVFLAAWAGRLWVRPFGPPLFGVIWLPSLLMGVLFALVLAAVVPARPPRTRSEAIAQARAEEAAVSMIGAFFWALLIGLLVAIVLGYLIP
jgi:hypothetical protein